MVLGSMLLRFECVTVGQTAFGQNDAGGSIGRIEYVMVERGQFQGGVECRSGGAADEQRRVETAGIHLTAEFLHLEKRRRNQAADADYRRMVLLSSGKDGLLVHHDAQVDDVETVAAQNDAQDILADIVYVALDRRVNDHRPAGRPVRARIHIRF